jgi:1,4-alpha-glucan branching enzyme
MANPFIQFVASAEIPYLDLESCPIDEKNGWLKDATEILKFLVRLENNNHSYNVHLAITPLFYELMTLPGYKDEFSTYLQHETDIASQVIQQWNLWEQDIIIAVRHLMNAGKLELLASPVTSAIMPMLSTSVGIRAHIHAGMAIMKKHFGTHTKGFWFPRGMYEPGLDLFLELEGILYSFLPKETVRLANPSPVYGEWKPVTSPHNIHFFPVSEGDTSIIDVLTQLFLNWKDAPLNECEDAVVTVNIDIGSMCNPFAGLHSSLFESMTIEPLQVEDYLNSHSLEIVHLCSSFFTSNQYSVVDYGNASLWKLAGEIERELERLLFHTPTEESSFEYLMTEWLIFTGMLSNSSKVSPVENIVQSFQHLKRVMINGNDKNVCRIEEFQKYPFKLAHSNNVISNNVKIDIPKKDSLIILMLTWEFPPNIMGGLASHTYGVSSSLVEAGCEVHIMTAWRQGLLAYEVVNGVHIHRVSPLNEAENDFKLWIGGLNLAMASIAMQLAKEIKFDIVHAHDWLVGAVAASLAELLSIPLFTTIHATEYGRNNGIYTELQQFIHEKEQQLIKKSQQLIVCSDYMRNELVSLFVADQQQIAVIPNGIQSKPTNISMDKLIATYPFFPVKKMVFSLGRIVKEKGFMTLIEAAILAREEELDIYFVIAGKGPMLETYRRMITEYQLENYLFLIGFIQEEQRDALFSLCDIAVFPSLYEPFGIVALEALALGKPTIVSETGGLKGIIKHMQTGLLMEPGNANQLLEHVSFLLENQQEAKVMGERGKKVVESLYSWKRIAEDTKRLIEDVLLINRI